jgi:hypothetical protein
LTVLFGVIGAAAALPYLVFTSIVQQRLPRLAGARVMAILSLMVFGAIPLGNLTIGAMIQWLGIPTTMAVQGALALAGAVLFAANRDLRHTRFR